MTTYAGFVVVSSDTAHVNPNISDELSEYGLDYWPAHESDTVQIVATTAHTRNAPIEIPGTSRAGAVAHSFLDDFYHRVHVVPQEINLGNIASERVETVEVWSAMFAPNELESIGAAGTEGITLTGPEAPPTTFKPLQSRLYSLRVGIDGPPVVDAVYTLNFESNAPTLRIRSNRVVAWTWQPDWSVPVVERIEWLTDVLQSHDGREQRTALRVRPRRAIEFEAWFVGRDRRIAELAVYGWGANVWAVPIWPDGVDLAATLPLGSTVVPIDTTGRDFQPGALAVIMTDSRTYETLEVQSSTTSAVTLKRATLREWGPGARIYPARPARLPNNFALPRFTDGVSSARVMFTVDGSVEYPAASLPATYRGKPVMTRQIDWQPGLEVELERKRLTLDGLVGAITTDDQAGMPMTLQRCGYTMTTKAEQESLRGLLYALRGRQVGLWVPTFTDDLVIVAPVAADAIEVDIEHCGYTRMIGQQINRRDVRISMHSGAVYYRRIVASEEIDANTERIALDAALGAAITPAQVRQVCFLMYARLDTDVVELSHWTGDVAETVLPFKGVRHEL